MEEDAEMMTVRKLLFAAAVALGVAASDSAVQAQVGGCSGPGCAGGRVKYPTLGAAIFGNKPALPTYQAAPWYLYWPYDAHFQTPAPVVGPWYGPPIHGNFPVNPYFPAPQHGYYGPIPGGGPPGGLMPPMPAGNPIPAGYGYPAPPAGYHGPQR
jgi:hypothetical protein